MSERNLGLAQNFLLITPIVALQLALFRLLVPPGFLNGDVAWFVMVADGITFGGQRLYVDFVEPNAPLASLIMAPAAALHRWAGIRIAEATMIWTLALTGIAFALAFPLTRRLSLKPGQLLVAQGFLLWVMLIIPGGSFGQRESLFTMLATPYVLAAALRGTSMQIGASLAVPIGMAAAIGAAVKPPMALVLLAVELTSLLRTRRVFHLEAIVLALSVSLYALMTLLALPLYFELIGGWASSLYFAYSSMPGDTTFPTLFIVFAAALIAALGAARRFRSGGLATDVPMTAAAVASGSFLGFLYFAYSSMATFSYPMKFLMLGVAILAALWAARGPIAGTSARALPVTLAAGATGAFLGFLLQWKGWGYQALPARQFGALALASSLAVGAGTTQLRHILVAFVALPLSASALILPLRAQPFTLRPNEDILQSARETDGAFLVLSTNVHAAFPEAAEIGRPWALRYPCLILLPGLLQSEERNGGVIEERYSKAKAEFVAAITEDLRRHQPSVVMVPEGQDQALPAGITGLDWLLRNRSFAEEWEKYREHDGSKRYRIFRRVLTSPS